MDTINKYELLSKAIHLLDERAIHPESDYFFCGDNADEGLSYCYDCIKVIKPDAIFGWNDDFMGGSGNNEHDGCLTCEHCGKILSYVLTDYGVSSEFGNFQEYGFDWSSQQECYELARVAHGMLDTDERQDKLLEILLTAKNVPLVLLEGTRDHRPRNPSLPAGRLPGERGERGVGLNETNFLLESTN